MILTDQILIIEVFKSLANLIRWKSYLKHELAHSYFCTQAGARGGECRYQNVVGLFYLLAGRNEARAHWQKPAGCRLEEA